MLDKGNPQVKFTLSLSLPVCTHTHEACVRICMGLLVGTDKGMIPKGKGKGKGFFKTVVMLY